MLGSNYLIKWTTKEGGWDVRFFKSYNRMSKFFHSLFKKRCEAVAINGSAHNIIGEIRFDASQEPDMQWQWYLEKNKKKMGRPEVKDKKERVLLFVRKSAIKRLGGMAATKRLLVKIAESDLIKIGEVAEKTNVFQE